MEMEKDTFIMANAVLNSVSNKQLASTMYLNQYRIGSKNLKATDTCISDIAEALKKESDNIQKIDTNIAGVAEIVNNNSAASQETAAVSEEQSSQVQMMVHIMEKFEI